jgi:acyl carrier protein
MLRADRIRQSVIQGIEQVTSKLVEIGDQDSFADFDIDSLDRMSLMLEVEEDLDLEFTDLDPKDVDCINDYIKLIQALPDASETTDNGSGTVAAKKN